MKIKPLLSLKSNGGFLLVFNLLILFSINSEGQQTLPPEIKKIFFETSKFNQPIWLELPDESSLSRFQEISNTPDIYESGIPSTSITMHTSNGLEDYNKYFLNFLIKNNYAKIETKIQTKHSNYGAKPNVYHFLFYSDEFKKNIQYYNVTENYQQTIKPYIKLAQRHLISIDYKNQYEDAPMGMKRTFYSITFSYNLENDLSKIPIIAKIFKGKGKIFKDPDDGTWKMVGPFQNLGVVLNDNNYNEFLNIIKNNYQPYKFETKATYDNSSTVNNTENSEHISNSAGETNKTLASPINRGISKKSFAGNLEIYIDKKAGTKQTSNFIFVFSNKENELEYQSQLFDHISNWLKKSIKHTNVNDSDLKKDSLFKVELIFTERFSKSITGGKTFWYADLTTKIYITRNGQHIKDDTFTRSTAFMNGKQDKWPSLEDAINKTQKRIGKILSDYMPID